MLQLSTTSIYEYLRPVDLLQLCLSCKDCQDVVVHHKVVVRDAYFKYYGPLLTAARIKEHTYLQLKSKEDYTYFFHETSKKYSALLILMADDARDYDDTLFNEWILAVEHFYSITDC